MKRPLLLTFLLFAMTVPVRADEPAPVAVVELFTSQGCSSCPAADRLLGELIAEAKEHGQPLIALAFHVDYWDGLGWPDPYAAPQFTARQRWYARVLGLRSVYTPQMIVNGTRQFVGSNRPAAERAIDEALARPAVLPVSIEKVERTDEGVRVRYAHPDAPEDVALHVALTQDEATTPVQRGENGGRTLREFALVRQWTSTPAKDDGGDVALSALPEDAPPMTVVVVAQRLADGAILGAASASLPPPPRDAE